MIFVALPKGIKAPEVGFKHPVVATLSGEGAPHRRTWKLSGTMYARGGLIKSSFTFEHKWLSGVLQQLSDLALDTTNDSYGTRITDEQILVCCEPKQLTSVKSTAKRYGHRKTKDT